MHKQQKQPTQHHSVEVPLDDLIVTDLHNHIPVDLDRLTKMAAAYAAGASWALHPLAVCRTPIGYELIDGRLRQQLGETTVPVRVFDLVEDEKAAFPYSSGKDRTSRPVTMEAV
jgi:hypothetical protein